MNPVKPRLLLSFLLVLALALAGCARQGDDADGGGGPLPAQDVGPEQAEALLKRAVDDLPERYGFEFRIKSQEKDLMRMSGTVDNASRTSYLEIKGDPSAFPGEEGMAGAEFLAAGFSIYATPAGALYHANGTSYVFPGAAPESQGLVPPPQQSPFGQFLEPEHALGLFRDDVNVTGVTPLLHRGKAAIEVDLEARREGEPVDATVILFTNPVRIAHVESVLPRDPENPADPFGGALLTGDFWYDAEVKLQPPEAVKRSLGLAFQSDRNPFDFGGARPTTWTFQASEGIPLDEVEAQVKNVTGMDGGDDVAGLDAGALPTRFAMKLSEGDRTEGGVTLTFADNDGDGKVSKGDTLSIAHDGEGEPPMVVLHDVKSGAYVVPGPGAFILVGLVGVLAVLLRRK